MVVECRKEVPALNEEAVNVSDYPGTDAGTDGPPYERKIQDLSDVSKFRLVVVLGS